MFLQPLSWRLPARRRHTASDYHGSLRQYRPAICVAITIWAVWRLATSLLGPVQGALAAVLTVAGRAPELKERLCPTNPDIRAQLVYAVEHERTETLRDFLLRRTGIGTSACQGKDCCESIARRMGELKGWEPRRVDREIGEYLEAIGLGERFREEPGPSVAEPEPFRHLPQRD